MLKAIKQKTTFYEKKFVVSVSVDGSRERCNFPKFSTNVKASKVFRKIVGSSSVIQLRQ